MHKQVKEPITISQLLKSKEKALILLGDIGATNARFALLNEEGVCAIYTLPCADYHSIDEAIQAYLQRVEILLESISAIRLSIACPITSDYIQMTNREWSFSTANLKESLKIEDLVVQNDFEALAYALPNLYLKDVSEITEEGLKNSPKQEKPIEKGKKGAPVVILGPGSGLGVASLIPFEKGGSVVWKAISGEGGHVSLSPVTALEIEVLKVLHKKYDHVSAERVLSGPGIVNLYRALLEVEGCGYLGTPYLLPHEIVLAALKTLPSAILNFKQEETEHYLNPVICHAAIEMFCGLLGTVAGNLALTLGGQGGVFIGGGIVPKLGPLFNAAFFRRRFEKKGRFQKYLEPIPTFLITHPYPVFSG